MKRKAANITLHRWTVRQVVPYLALLCVVCPLIGLPDAVSQSSTLSQVSAGEQSSKTSQEIEYEVKAAFIYNFMKFIEWPQQHTDEQNTVKAMTIGILGDNPFGDAFVPILDKEVHGRKINLVEIPSYHAFYNRSSDKAGALAAYQAHYQSVIETCDVLFLCPSEKNYMTTLIELTPGHGILTISDIPGFAKTIGVIGFVKDNNKIRFEINLDMAQRENFKIRSQLLTLAKEVYQKK